MARTAEIIWDRTLGPEERGYFVRIITPAGRYNDTEDVQLKATTADAARAEVAAGWPDAEIERCDEPPAEDEVYSVGYTAADGAWRLCEYVALASGGAEYRTVPPYTPYTTAEAADDAAEVLAQKRTFEAGRKIDNDGEMKF